MVGLSLGLGMCSLGISPPPGSPLRAQPFRRSEKMVKLLPYKDSSLHSSSFPQGVLEAWSLGGTPGLWEGLRPFLLLARVQPGLTSRWELRK